MREECKYFLQGDCRFGKKCKYLHITRTALIDPPAWIHSCFSEVGTCEISPDEARLRFLDSPGTFQREWDDLFVHNYSVLCKKLDALLQDSRVGSFTQRCVDIRDRRNLGKLVPVFDHGRLSEEIDAQNRARRQHTADQRHIEVDSRRTAGEHAGSRQDYRQAYTAGSGARGRDSVQYRRDTRSWDHEDSGGRTPRDGAGREYNRRPDYHREDMRTKDAQHRPLRDRQGARGPRTYERYPQESMGSREGTEHSSRERYDTGPGYRDSYAARNRPRRDDYGYEERGRGSGGRGDARGWKGDAGGRQHIRRGEDAVDLMQDDVVIGEFLPNDETDEFEL